MVDALGNLQDYKDKLQITHQTGELDFESVRQGYAENDWQTADIRRYISDMVSQFAKTDLIICRAGAATCAEVAAAGKAALMIPLPTAADDHQRRNAEALVNQGAARMILQKDLSSENLAKEIINLIESPEKITAMEKAAKKMAKADAAEAAVDLIKQLSVSKTDN